MDEQIKMLSFLHLALSALKAAKGLSSCNQSIVNGAPWQAISRPCGRSLTGNFTAQDRYIENAISYLVEVCNSFTLNLRAFAKGSNGRLCERCAGGVVVIVPDIRLLVQPCFPSEDSGLSQGQPLQIFEVTNIEPEDTSILTSDHTSDPSDFATLGNDANVSSDETQAAVDASQLPSATTNTDYIASIFSAPHSLVLEYVRMKSAFNEYYQYTVRGAGLQTKLTSKFIQKLICNFIQILMTCNSNFLTIFEKALDGNMIPELQNFFVCDYLQFQSSFDNQFKTLLTNIAHSDRLVLFLRNIMCDYLNTLVSYNANFSIAITRSIANKVSLPALKQGVEEFVQIQSIHSKQISNLMALAVVDGSFPQQVCRLIRDYGQAQVSLFVQFNASVHQILHTTSHLRFLDSLVIDFNSGLKFYNSVFKTIRNPQALQPLDLSQPGPSQGFPNVESGEASGRN